MSRAFILPGRVSSPRESESRPDEVETPDGQRLHTRKAQDEAGDRRVVIGASVAARDTVGLEDRRCRGHLRTRRRGVERTAVRVDQPDRIVVHVKDQARPRKRLLMAQVFSKRKRPELLGQIRVGK